MTKRKEALWVACLLFSFFSFFFAFINFMVILVSNLGSFIDWVSNHFSRWEIIIIFVIVGFIFAFLCYFFEDDRPND